MAFSQPLIFLEPLYELKHRVFDHGYGCCHVMFAQIYLGDGVYDHAIRAETLAQLVALMCDDP